MKAATVHEIKQELLSKKPAELTELCLRMAKFKKENKELLTYLLFESANEDGYVAEVKQEMESLFSEINFSHLYFVKKSLRKIVRIINKHTRYISSKEADATLRMYFCKLIKNEGIPIGKNAVIKNMYTGQLEKAEKAIASIHEDLQYDYLKEWKRLEL